MKLFIKIFFVLSLLLNILYSQRYTYVLPNETLLVQTPVKFERLYIHMGGVLIVKGGGLLEARNLVVGLFGEKDDLESIIYNHGQIITDTFKLVKGVSLFNSGTLKSRLMYLGSEYHDEEDVVIKNYGDLNVDSLFILYTCHLMNYKNMKVKYLYNKGIFYTSGGDISVDYLYNKKKIVLNVSKLISSTFVSMSYSSIYFYNHVFIETDTLSFLERAKIYIAYLDNNHVFVKQYCYIHKNVSFVDYTSRKLSSDKTKKTFCVNYKSDQICNVLNK